MSNYASGEVRYPRRAISTRGFAYGIPYAGQVSPGGDWVGIHSDGEKTVWDFDDCFAQIEGWFADGLWIETFDHHDKDPHGMYQSEHSELAALQIQIRRVVDQCEAVIGDKAHTIPFGMAVSETIAELKKRAEVSDG